MSTLSLLVLPRHRRLGFRARGVAVAAGALLLAACAVRLGGPKPEEYRVLTLRGAAGDDPAAVAASVRSLAGDIAFLAAPADSAWFTAVASGAGLLLSGPAGTSDMRVGFLAWQPEGDTTVALVLEGGGTLPVQDALYAVDDDRYLDLMAVHLAGGLDTRAAARALLAYVATDVMSSVAVLLAVSAERPADASRMVELLAPVFTSESSCESAEPGGQPPVRLLYGPALRIRCVAARSAPAEAAALVADVVVRR